VFARRNGVYFIVTSDVSSVEACAGASVLRLESDPGRGQKYPSTLCLCRSYTLVIAGRLTLTKLKGLHFQFK